MPKPAEMEWIEVIKLVNDCKDTIKKSSQAILKLLDHPGNNMNIESEKLEILNALGKIGTLSNNAGRVNEYADAWSTAFSHLLSANPRLMPSIMIKHLLDQICSVSFYVEKKGTKIQITVPINFNALKI